MNIYWIGARQYDIEKNNFFVGSITCYGDDTSNNCSFCNNNYTNDYSEFIKTNLDNILNKDKDAYFMFANEHNAYQYNNDIYKKSICINQLYLIESLNDKIFTRNFFSDYVNTPNSIIVSASSCVNYKFIKDIFNNNFSNFVLQEANGAGGQKTYFLTSNHIPEISSAISYVLVTPYFDNAITANVHIVVSSESYKIMPPSLQITVDKFKYSGSDFIAFNSLPLQRKNQIIGVAKEIARKVQSIGGRGIFGVDLLVKEDNILFLECNYRYQGSSFLLNRALEDNGFPSLFKFRYDSFYKNLDYIPDDIYKMPVLYSSFRRTEMNANIFLPKPLMVIATNKSSFASEDRYIQYEIFNTSIIRNIAKQEVQNLC